MWPCIKYMLIFTFVMLFLAFLRYIPLDSDYPKFKIESVTVALDENDISNNQSQSIRSTWDIGFSVKNLDTNYLTISVRSMSSNWSTNSVKNVGNTTNSFNETVIVPLPRDQLVLDEPMMMGRGLTLKYDLLFRRDEGIDQMVGTCENMMIEISSNATKGMMEEGPEMCYVDRIRPCRKNSIVEPSKP